MQTVTPAMARFFAGTRDCQRCEGRLDIIRNGAYKCAVTCRLCGQQYLHVQIDVRPATADSGAPPDRRGRRFSLAPSILLNLIGRALSHATWLGGFASRAPVSDERCWPGTDSTERVVPVPFPSAAQVDQLSSTDRSAA